MNEVRQNSVRMLPSSIEAEESVLGALMIVRDLYPRIAGLIETDDFYSPKLRHVYDAIGKLFVTGSPIDPVTVSDQLRREGLLDQVGGPGVLVNLQAGAPTTTNVAHYARIVSDYSILRKAIGLAYEAQEQAYGLPTNITGAVDQIAKSFTELAARTHAASEGPPARLADGVGPWLDDMEARAENKRTKGLRTGLWALDGMLGGGLKPGKVYVVAARPGQGKSSLVAQIAGFAAQTGIPVHYASVEMTAVEVLERVVAQMGIPAQQLTSPSLQTEWSRIGAHAAVINEWPLRIRDNPSQTPAAVVADAHQTRNEEGSLGLVVVDYLTTLKLEESRNENRTRAIGRAMWDFKTLARELNVPVVIAAQLSRDVTKEGRRPTLADLRESGDIENTADVVVFLHNPDRRGQRTISATELVIAKQRAGKTGVVHVAWVPSRTLFANVQRPANPTPEPPPELF